jgi:hypothetical protein
MPHITLVNGHGTPLLFSLLLFSSSSLPVVPHSPTLLPEMTKRYTPLRLIDPTCYTEGTAMREAAGGRMRLDRLVGSQ